MAKAFSLVSWNVEPFKVKRDRVYRVVELLGTQAPAVFTILVVQKV